MKRLVFIMVLASATNWVTAQVNRNFTLIMRTTGSMVLWDMDTIRTYGFATKLSQNPPVPGPVITVDEGDSVFVLARNISQGPPHTIHWHGLDVDQANDGTPATSFELHHMQDTVYRFLASHAGTYVYHCHMGDVVHVQMGMYGLLVVRAKNGVQTAWTGGPAFDKEFGWLTSEIDKSWHDTIPDTEHDSGSTGHENFMVPDFIPDYFLVNGKSHQQIREDSSTMLRAKAGEQVYLRLANIGYLDNFFVFPASLQARVIDSDGRPLPASFNTDTLQVSPGERYGVFLKASAELSDSVAVRFLDMNTKQVMYTGYVPVEIKGTIGFDDPSEEDRIRLWPNPASHTVNILYRGEESVSVKVFDLFGRQALQAAGRSKLTVSTDVLATGVYIVQVSTVDGTVQRKLVIE